MATSDFSTVDLYDTYPKKVQACGPLCRNFGGYFPYADTDGARLSEADLAGDASIATE